MCRTCIELALAQLKRFVNVIECQLQALGICIIYVVWCGFPAGGEGANIKLAWQKALTIR